MVMRRPEVSVVMPAFNAAATIESSMHSALMQADADLEIVVVDDRSSDATWEIIEEMMVRDPRVVGARQARNQGVAAARNLGLEAARGRKIAFLDSDDRWHAGKLAAQVAFMEQTGSAICYAPYRRVDETGACKSVVVPPTRVDYRDMLRSNHIGNLTAIYDRSLGDGRFQRIGHEDYVFWLDMVKRAGHAVRLPGADPVADYLVRSGSLSGNKWRAARWQWDIYRRLVKLDVVRSAWYFTQYAAIAAAKRQ